MFVMKYKEKFYELLHAESSRLFCTKQKEIDDQVKLWRETNGGMYWVHKSCKPSKDDEFGIIGVVAGKTLILNVLVRDTADVYRYYHLHKSEIPVQQSDSHTV
jgi:hypothetical protein